MVQAKYLLGLAATMALSACQVQAAFPSNALVNYWGQNSAGTQKNLASYCDDSTDVLVLSFLMVFNVGGLPTLNFANACETTFDGTTLLNCPQIGADIKTCQAKGKTILLSLGGASGAYGFSSDAQATTFANTLYGMFGKGTAQYRPFGDAVVNGYDFDIEGGGSTGYATLAKTLKSLDSSTLITGAPQCPFPDAMMGDALNNGPFDAVFVQFYNNYCSATGGSFNFATWDNWAKTQSYNKNVKVLLGLPGSPSAASSGYADFSQIQTAVNSIKQYSSFGGVMFWDASQSYASGLSQQVASLIHSGGGGNTQTTTTTTTKASTTTQASTTTSSATKTTTTSSSSPTSTPTGCVTNGSPCSPEGKYACAGGSFGICDHGAWVLQSCGNGLTCFTTTDGASVYCAQSTGSSNTCSVQSAAVAPLAYSNSLVQTQLSVVNSTSDSWTATVNARRTTTKPFGSKVVVNFKVPSSNMTIDSVSNGKISKSGSTVSMQVNNPHKKSMDLVFTLHGSIAEGSVFIAPTSNNLQFQS